MPLLALQVLPWQAVCCPRAVEALRDIRLAAIQEKHDGFIAKMTRRLQDKVRGSGWVRVGQRSICRLLGLLVGRSAC